MCFATLPFKRIPRCTTIELVYTHMLTPVTSSLEEPMTKTSFVERDLNTSSKGICYFFGLVDSLWHVVCSSPSLNVTITFLFQEYDVSKCYLLYFRIYFGSL